MEIIGGCFPFENKIFVQADGKLGMCESVSNRFSLGNVERGFDEDKIRSLYNATEQVYNKKCRDCWAQRLLSSRIAVKCFVWIARMGGLVKRDLLYDKVCDRNEVKYGSI